MKHLKTSIVLMFISLSINFSQTMWEFDKAHTNIGFSVSHLIISDVDGNFNSFEGSIETMSKMSDNFENAKVKFSVDVKSINTNNNKRDEHLRSNDFFNAEKFPKMKFESKSFIKISGNKYIMIGYLTIRDIKKEIELNVKCNGTVKYPWGNTKAGFKISGELNRFDYNLKWNNLLETGGAIVGKTVELDIDVELKKQG